MRRYLFLLIVAVLTAAPMPAAEPGVSVSEGTFPPAEAAKRMALPEGFNITLFAGEPDLVQPIGYAMDDRGRLWVAECRSYPDWVKDGKEGADRIVIFEDKDGDGRFDGRKVFWDKGANVSGIELGFGGVWVCATPNLLFIPDADGDDAPDGPPQIVLDGWNLDKAGHNVFNRLAWGPDGWLYGCNGIQSESNVGKPGAADEQRVRINCGVWRLHPRTRVFEAFAHGTTNPWGLDFDDYGQMFITNCVLAHVWHVVPGARFKRMYGEDLNPNAYGLMDTCADHLHWAGGEWTESRDGAAKHGEAGGGHAHVGAMVYLGDNWPDAYRNTLFTCNLHGYRVNNDFLERKGSGYVARHGKDFLMANDPWFRGMEMQYGPDGGVYLTDWNDTGECHDLDDVHRESGRMYKITYGQAARVEVDLAQQSDEELVQLQLHKNDWFVRHARRLLHERAVAGKLGESVHASLRKILADHPDVTRKLRAIWALHVTGGLDEAGLAELLGEPEEYVRAWAIRLAVDDRQVPAEMLARLESMAKSDSSPVVRLHLASALQRLPLERRWKIAEGLVAHADDANDPNLPLMIWYGIEPLIPAGKNRGLGLVVSSKIPLIREYIARRVAAASAE